MLTSRKANYQRQYRQHNPIRTKAYLALQRRRRRIKVLDHYGNECACCGESHIEFLCVDHINGGGTQLRKTGAQSGGGDAMYKYLIREGFPEGYRTLCHNCNMSLGFYNYCPHTEQRPKDWYAKDVESVYREIVEREGGRVSKFLG